MCPGGAASNRTARRSARPTVRWTVGQSAGRPPPSPPAAGCRSQDAHLKREVRVFLPANIGMQKYKTFPFRCLPTGRGRFVPWGRGVEQDGAPQRATNSPVDCWSVRGQTSAISTSGRLPLPRRALQTRSACLFFAREHMCENIKKLLRSVASQRDRGRVFPYIYCASFKSALARTRNLWYDHFLFFYIRTNISIAGGTPCAR